MTRQRDWPRLLTAAALGLGILLRVRAYLAGRPLWLDEAMLALNIVSRPLWGLLRPLAMDQSAPVPFLWAERVAATIGGVNEFALRALPLVAGLLLLPVLRRLAARLLTPAAVPLAVAIAALSPALVYFSNEVKPYAVDALLSATVVLTALAVLEAPGSTPAWRRLWAAGTVALLASAPAFMVTAGVIPALLLRTAGPGEPDIRPRTALTAVAWAALFGAVYLLVYRAAAQNSYLQTYWNSYFLDPLAPGFGGRLVDTLGSTLRDCFVGEGGDWRAPAALLLLVPVAIGAMRLGRTRGLVVPALLLLPILAAFGASAIHRYPIAPRLMLYSAPLWILLVVAGVEEICERLGPRAVPRLLAVAAVGLLPLPARFAAAEFRSPSRPQDLRPLVEIFRREHAPGDAAYVFGRAVPAWVFYTSDWQSPDVERVDRLGALVSSTGAAFRNRESRRRPVREEGDSLAYGHADWTELIGVPTGQGPSATDSGSELPDTGWADNEARRIRAAGRPRVWVVLSSYRAAVPGLLMTSMERQGGTLLARHETTQALLLHYSLADSAGTPAGSGPRRER